MRFDRRTAVITGGAIGFGRAFARALVAEGASVVIADVDVEMAERTAAELVDAGGKAIAVAATLPIPIGWTPLSRRRSNGSAVSTL